MSTSCKLAAGRQEHPKIQPFPYAELHGPLVHGELVDGELSSATTAASREALAMETGRKEGEARARTVFDQQVAEIRDGVRRAISDFASERAHYYRQVETEVVQLALSIARKILRREAQIDPLLLAGMVRVALERIESGTRIVVRVNPHQVSECRAYFAQHLEEQAIPEVAEDPNLAKDHCVLQTELGTTELGPEVQLKEIEQGLMDLLEERPR